MIDRTTLSQSLRPSASRPVQNTAKSAVLSATIAGLRSRRIPGSSPGWRADLKGFCSGSGLSAPSYVSALTPGSQHNPVTIVAAPRAARNPRQTRPMWVRP